MTTPQAAIITETSQHFYFLEYKLKSSFSVEKLISSLSNIPKEKIGTLQLIAFGPQLSKQLLKDRSPEDLHDMTALKGPLYSMPEQQNDLLFWLHGNDMSDIYDQVLVIQKTMKNVATIELDQSAFTYHDSRDLTGFEDGTANPKDDSRYPIALISEGNSEGGRYVFTQKWEHDLDAFLELPVNQQEKIIGRTKIENVELSGDDMPKNSHVSRTDVKVNGEAMKIYRRSAHYGNSTSKGLMFLCFACDQSRIQIQLERMVGITNDQISDHLMKYSSPVSGSYWYAPPTDTLAQLLNTQ